MPLGNMPEPSEQEPSYRVTITRLGPGLPETVLDMTCREFVLLPIQDDMAPDVQSSVRPLARPFFLLRALWSTLGLNHPQEDA